MGGSITHFPGGVSSFGVPVWPDPYNGFAKVVFVGTAAAGYACSAAGASYDAPTPTLAAAVAQADPLDRGTLIVVRKGSNFSVDSADWLSGIGSRKRIVIRAEGEGVERAKLTWTIAGSTLLLDTDSLVLDNLILQLEPTTGTVTVAAPITASGAGCMIRNCRVNFGTDANNKVTIGVTTTAAANDFKFMNNVCRGAAAATCTTFLRIVGGDSIEVANNSIVGGTTANGVGVIQALTTAPTNLDIHDNYLENNIAAATAAMTFMAGATGNASWNRLAYNGANLAGVTTPGLVAFYENRIVNARVDGTAETGATFGTASA